MNVRVQDLHFGYGKRRVLTAISARAEPGRITAVLGPNAAGKSTLLRCLIGALQPQHGLVYIDDLPVHRSSARQLATRLAYVPQRPALSAAFSVKEVVELGRYALPPDPNRVDQALEQLALTELAQRPFPELSAGQQQRVMLARALAQLPPAGCLVLDEPMSAMDLRHVHRAMAILRKLTDSGASVIMVLHDLGLAASVADDIWLLRQGRLAAAGTKQQVLGLPRLEEVFGITFQWLTDEDGHRHLVAR